MSAEPTYRTREEFINLLMEKLREGLIRQLKKANEKLEEIESKKELLKRLNLESEQAIEKKIQ